MNVFPVVHINSPLEATAQANIALDAGADGVYLINHHERDQLGDIFDTFNNIKKDKPDAFVGVNLLGLGSLQACKVIYQLHRDERIQSIPDGLWADNALDESQTRETISFKKMIARMNAMRYLGGISFKYTSTYTEDPELAYQLAIDAQERVDVITTSGAGTGSAPTVEKITAMKQAADKVGKSLAVASGISLDNLVNYQGIVDEVLISSSLETRPYSGIFDRDKLIDFIRAAHKFQSN